MSYIAVTCESIVCKQHSTATLELYSLSFSLSSWYRVSVPVSPSWSTRQVRRFASAGAIALGVYHTHLLYTATLYYTAEQAQFNRSCWSLFIDTQH